MRRKTRLVQENKRISVEDIEIELDEIRDMVDHNEHIGAYIYAVENLIIPNNRKYKKLLKALQGLSDVYDYFGSMESGLSDVEYALYKRMKFAINDTFYSDVADVILSCF